MTHTAGLTYGCMFNHPVDAMYRSAGFEWDTPRASTCRLLQLVLAQIPLSCQPGTQWNYSARPTYWAASSKSRRPDLEDVFARRLRSLGMKETTFFVEGESAERLAVCTARPRHLSGDSGQRHGRGCLQAPERPLGGSGLVSSAGGLSPVHPDAGSSRRARMASESSARDRCPT